MKNRLFWVGAFAYFIGDLLTTYVGISIGITETNIFIKTFPFMLLAKFGVLLFMFGIFNCIEYLSISTNNKKTEEFIKKFITGELIILGVGVGIFNNILVIGGAI